METTKLVPRHTTTSGMEWNDFLELLNRLHTDGNNRFYLLMGIGCYTGLRISDILTLKWTDVLNKDTIRLQEKKTGKPREIKFNGNLTRVINEGWAATTCRDREHEYIFSNRSGTPFSVQYVNRELHNIFFKYQVKVQNGSSHSLRKTFSKRVYEQNGKTEDILIVLSKILNHSNIAITREYLGLTKQVIDNVYVNL